MWSDRKATMRPTCSAKVYAVNNQAGTSPCVPASTAQRAVVEDGAPGTVIDETERSSVSQRSRSTSILSQPWLRPLKYRTHGLNAAFDCSAIGTNSGGKLDVIDVDTNSLATTGDAASSTFSRRSL